MPDKVSLSTAALFGFLLVLARVGGALVFVPLPGIKGAPEPARAALALAFTLALYSRWPLVPADSVTARGFARDARIKPFIRAPPFQAQPPRLLPVPPRRRPPDRPAVAQPPHCAA